MWHKGVHKGELNMFKLLAVTTLLFSSAVMAETKLNCVHNGPAIKSGELATKSRAEFNVHQGDIVIKYEAHQDNRSFDKTFYYQEKINVARYIDREMRELSIIGSGHYYGIRFDRVDNNLIAYVTLGLIKDNKRTDEISADFNFSVNNTQTFASSPEFGELTCKLN